MVWWSSDETRRSGVVSALAIIETILSSSIFLKLLNFYGLTWHHLVFLIASPLVLMRSTASVKQGVSLFEKFFDKSIEAARPMTSKDVALVNVMCVASTVLFGVLILKFHFGNFKDMKNASASFLISWILVNSAVAVFGGTLGSKSIVIIRSILASPGLSAFGERIYRLSSCFGGDGLIYGAASVLFLPGVALGILLHAVGVRFFRNSVSFAPWVQCAAK